MPMNIDVVTGIIWSFDVQKHLGLKGLYCKGTFILRAGLRSHIEQVLAHCINQTMYVPVHENCSSGSVNYWFKEVKVIPLLGKEIHIFLTQ